MPGHRRETDGRRPGAKDITGVLSAIRRLPDLESHIDCRIQPRGSRKPIDIRRNHLNRRRVPDSRKLWRQEPRSPYPRHRLVDPIRSLPRNDRRFHRAFHPRNPFAAFHLVQAAERNRDLEIATTLAITPVQRPSPTPQRGKPRKPRASPWVPSHPKSPALKGRTNRTTTNSNLANPSK